MRFLLLLFCLPLVAGGQLNLRWQNVDSIYGPLPESVHVYSTNQPIDTSPFKAFYLVASLKDKKLDFTTDTTLNRRLTPTGFYEKSGQPLVVVNGTFFSFETNRNLNVVIRNGELVSFNLPFVQQKKGDTVVQLPVFRSAISIDKKRRADVAWIKTDTIKKVAYADQYAGNSRIFWQARRPSGEVVRQAGPVLDFSKWKMQTAIGGGPVLLQQQEITIANEYEHMFTGKAINDKHPRTAMGYTADDKLIILVIEGRNSEAAGATLRQEAQILKDLGCVEALNLDGGGSSCMLVNGKETIKPSDPKGQRPVPAVFLIKKELEGSSNSF